MTNKKCLMAFGAMCATLSMASPASADGNLFFLMDGDTFTQPFAISNTSTAGESVLSFGFDLAGTGYVFDPVDLGPPGNGTAGTPFTPQGGSGITTGIVNPVNVVDGSTFFSMDFTDFTPGETFSWLLDIDPSGGGSPSVFGNNLIGASVYVDFSNGLRGSGLIEAVAGNSDAGQLRISTFTPTPPRGVPEPATWAMMMLGFGVVGASMRANRRRQKLTVQYA